MTTGKSLHRFAASYYSPTRSRLLPLAKLALELPAHKKQIKRRKSRRPCSPGSRRPDVQMTHRSICLPAAEMEGKSAPQTPARRTNEYESSLNDDLAVRGSIRAATSRNINRVLMQVVDHESKPAPGFEPGTY